MVSDRAMARRLVAASPLRQTFGCDPTPVRVGFVVGKNATGTQLSPRSVIPPILRPGISFSAIDAI